MTVEKDLELEHMFAAPPAIDPTALSKMAGPLFEDAPFPKVKGVEVLDFLPDLDVDLLSDIVLWAYLDDRQDKRAQERFGEWGSWDQGTWGSVEAEVGSVTRDDLMGQPLLRCSSAFCIAGQAVVQSGYAMLFPDNDGGDASFCAPYYWVNEKNTDGTVTKARRIQRGKKEQISSKAFELLGLYRGESGLFGGGNNIEEVISLSCYFARKRGVELHLPQEVLDLDQKYADDQWASLYH